MAKQGMIPEQVFVVPSADASQLTLDAFFEGTLTDRLMRTLSTEPLTHLQPQIQMRPIDTRLKSFDLTESFMIYLKASLLVGAVLSSPLASRILTPTPDATNMLAMFVPLALLYFVGILLCRFIPRGSGLGGQ